MVELDYAYLADYAAVQDGKLTAVGASFTHLAVPRVPSGRLVAVAGRIRASADTESVDVGIDIAAPAVAYRLKLDMTLTRDPAAQPYSGKVGFLFAAMVQMPFPAAGLYRVDVLVGDGPPRHLAFEVITGQGTTGP